MERSRVEENVEPQTKHESDTWITFSTAAKLLGVRYQQVYARAFKHVKLDHSYGANHRLITRTSQIQEWHRQRRIRQQQENVSTIQA